MNNFNISVSDNKILVQPSERMSKSLFSVFRSEGWLWSRRENAFMFNRNESGFLRVNRLVSRKFLNRYGISEEDKAEANEFAFEFENEAVRLAYEKAVEQIQAKKEAEQAEKTAKEDQASKNRMAKAQKVIEQLKKFSNGFGNSAGALARDNWNLLESGVRKYISVKEYCEENGIVANIPNDIVLSIEIRTTENYVNYYKKENFVTVSVYEHQYKEETQVLISGSGFYSCKMKIAKVERRSIKDYIKLSEIINDEIEKRIMENYIDYKAGKKDAQTDIMSTLRVSEPELEQLIREKFTA